MLAKIRKERFMEPVLAVLIGCLIYITVFILVSWIKDIFTGGK